MYNYNIIYLTEPTLGEATIIEDSTTPYTLSISYTPPGGNGVFDKYKFQLDPDGVHKEKIKDDDQRNVVFTKLVAGTVYNVYMWVESGNKISLPKNLTILTSTLCKYT